jgi:hypothetical protein
MKPLRRLALGLAAALALAASSLAQTVAYPAAGETYTQDFNTLLYGANARSPWTNGVTLPGWHAVNHLGEPFTLYQRRNGELAATGHLIAMGPNQTDLALGFQPHSNQVQRLGLALANTTGLTLQTASLAFRLEFWRQALRDAPLRITVEFQIFEAGRGDLAAEGGWTALENYLAPHNTAPADVRAEPLDGNALDNSIQIPRLEIAKLAWAPNQELWLRWTFGGPGPRRHMVGLDDVAFTALPVR